MFVLLTAVILAAAATATGTLAAVGEHAVSARLLLVDDAPVMFRGVGFKPAEVVRITVDTPARDVTRTTTASSAGGFTMTVPGVGANACRGFAATAIGSKGSRATFKRPPGQCGAQQ
jgi:hypothetical protein